MTTKHQTFQVAPGKLQPNPWNSNSVGPEMEARIDASIQKLGFFKPIIVRELGPDTFEILGGEHRARSAQRLGMATVPVFSLGVISDTEAKAIGVADNARYGEDDSFKLADILRDVGEGLGAVEDFLPYSDQDLAGIFATKDLDFDSFGLDDKDEATDDLPTLADKRPTRTHELMRFMVPVEDREAVQKLVDTTIKTRGLASEQDSAVAAGMALVMIANAAREVM